MEFLFSFHSVVRFRRGFIYSDLFFYSLFLLLGPCCCGMSDGHCFTLIYGGVVWCLHVSVCQCVCLCGWHVLDISVFKVHF
jgi:hypothetical protein